MQDIEDRIAESLPIESDQQKVKASPDLWVVVGMAVQWLISRFGENFGIDYDTLVAWANTLSEITRDTDGGTATVVAAVLWGAGKLGWNHYKSYKGK